MSTKVTVAMKDGQVMAAKGGRKKAAKSGGKVLAVLRRGQFKLLWIKPYVINPPTRRDPPGLRARRGFKLLSY